MSFWGWLTLFVAVLLIVRVVRGYFAAKRKRVEIKTQERSGGWMAAGKYIAIPWLLSQCQRYNPSLTWSQTLLLGETLNRIFDAWDRGLAIQPVLRSAIALAVPNAYLAFQIFEGFLGDKTALKSPQTDRTTTHTHTPKNGQPTAIGYDGFKYGIDISKRCPNVVTQKLILDELSKSPTCAITLEPILNPVTGKINAGVVALCSEQQQSHVFLYRREALEKWFAEAEIPTNPLTRQTVNPQRDLITLS